MGAVCSSPKRREKTNLSPSNLDFPNSPSSPEQQKKSSPEQEKKSPPPPPPPPPPPVEKILQVSTSAKDIMGIGIQCQDKTDLSCLSLTDMLQNLKVLIDLITNIIDSNIKKSQLLKAVCRRVQSLEKSFNELKKKNSQLSKEPIVNLLYIVRKIHEEVQKLLSDDKSLWEKFKDVMIAQKQLARLVDLNDELTKAQNDLLIPLQMDEALEIKTMFETLKEIEIKNVKIYKSLENAKVLQLAKDNLTNEEAFKFWLGIKII